MKQLSFFRNVGMAGLLLFALGLPISHVPAQIGIGISFLAFVAERIRSRRWNLSWHPVFVPLLVYIGWNLFSAAISERPSHSLVAVLDNEWPMFIMLMLYWLTRTERDLMTLIRVFLVTASAAVVYAVWQSVGGWEFYRGVALTPMGWGFYRSVGFYGFYLTFAAFAMIVFFFSVIFGIEFKKWPYAVLSALSLLAIITTFARSIWLALAAGIPALAFTRGLRTGIFVVVTFLVFGTGLYLSMPAFRERTESIGNSSENETRLNLWKTALEMSKAHPVFGVGEDNWDYHFERYKVPGFYDTTVHPHNDYLTVLVSSGIPGLIAFIATWLVLIARGFRLLRSGTTRTTKAIVVASLFSIAGLLIGGMFQNYYGTFINCLGWWFVAGMLMAAERHGGGAGYRESPAALHESWKRGNSSTSLPASGSK